MNFRRGDKVRVIGKRPYGGRVTNYTGNVVRIYNNGVVGMGEPCKLKYGVNIDGARNPESEGGLFWFSDSDLRLEGYPYHITDEYNTPSNFAIVPQVKQIIFNAPKTIVLWDDGSKTIVTCGKDDVFDEYAGLCAAVTKRLFGSTNAINKLLKSDIIKRGV